MSVHEHTFTIARHHLADASPVVSVVIPVQNRPLYIQKALKSCESACSTLPIEIIIVDDGSTDNTVETVCALSSDLLSRHKARLSLLVLQQQRQGACVARNLGLTKAKGEFVKFLDSDDYLVSGALQQEVQRANETGADVVVSGWIGVRVEDGVEIVSSRNIVAAPEISLGVDDMLKGRAPIVSAALYRREFISNLSWDPEWTKAQDWGWAWRVCLAGASISILSIPTSVYCNHNSADRITNQKDLLSSTKARQIILQMVECSLRRKGELTAERSKLLAQYYYKDSKVLAEHNPPAWLSLWTHCRELCPDFKPMETSSFAKPFVALFGGYWGTRFYVLVRNTLRNRVFSRQHMSNLADVSRLLAKNS